jgi:hypothetical protein
MSKKLGEREGAMLGGRSWTDMHRKLKREGERLEGDWNPDDAFNFFVTAWHLYNDWMRESETGRTHLAVQKVQRRNLPLEMQEVIDAVRDIANGSKHYRLDLPDAKKRVIQETYDGETDSYWAYFHRERMPGFATSSGYEFSTRKLRNFMLAYFDWAIDDSVPLKAFPGDLLWKIWWSNPANHVLRSAITASHVNKICYPHTVCSTSLSLEKWTKNLDRTPRCSTATKFRLRASKFAIAGMQAPNEASVATESSE